MFDNFNKSTDTVKQGFSILEGDEHWKHCKELIGVDTVKCAGYICGKNRYGAFMALVGDDGNAYYLPKWYAAHVSEYGSAEIDFLKSLNTIKVEKREYDNTFTFDVYLIDYQGKPIHI